MNPPCRRMSSTMKLFIIFFVVICALALLLINEAVTKPTDIRHKNPLDFFVVPVFVGLEYAQKDQSNIGKQLQDEKVPEHRSGESSMTQDHKTLTKKTTASFHSQKEVAVQTQKSPKDGVNPNDKELHPLVAEPPANVTEPDIECYVCKFNDSYCADSSSWRELSPKATKLKVKCGDRHETPSRYCSKIKLKNGRVQRDCSRERRPSSGCRSVKVSIEGKQYPGELCLCANTEVQNSVPCNLGILRRAFKAISALTMFLDFVYPHSLLMSL